MKKTYLLLLCILAASCAPSIKSIPHKTNNYTKPDLNTVHSKDIGDMLVLTGTEVTQEAYKITQAPDNLSMSMIKYPYTEGKVLPLSGENKEWYLYYDNDNFNHGTLTYIAGIAKHKQQPRKIYPFISSNNGFSTRMVDDFSVEETTFNKDCSTCFKKEFIYNGKSGNTLKFIYREYINDMARPAFTQDLQYDLNDGNMIGFKGLRIEVVKATNTNIDYKVISYFG